MTILLFLVGMAVQPTSIPEPECLTTANAASLAKRASPIDSVVFRLGDALVKVCYGRPSARGRVMIGGTYVPFGQLWRTGANEPTMIHTTAPIVLGGVRLEAGTVSVYSIPGPTEWSIIFNRSTEQWGDEGSYDQKVRAMEVGRAKVQSTRLSEPIEQFTIRSELTKAGSGSLVLEWEKTRVAIPMQADR